MNNKFLDRFFWIVGADIRTSKNMDVVNSPVHKFSYNLHNMSFLIFLVLAFLFYGDVFLLKGAISSTFINIMGINSSYLKYIEYDQIKLFYVLCFLVSVVTGIIAAILFYKRNRDQITREDLVGTKIFYNVYVTSIINIIFGFLLGILGFFFGGYILSVYLVPWVGLDKIPGSLIIQLVLAIKVNAFIAVSVFSTSSLFMPYGIKKKI